MKGNMEQRACEEAVYIIESRGTVRDAARKFGISKSTVHKDISQRLPLFNRSLYLQVKAILEENKAQRHIRGGLATRRKYKGALWWKDLTPCPGSCGSMPLRCGKSSVTFRKNIRGSQ